MLSYIVSTCRAVVSQSISYAFTRQTELERAKIFLVGATGYVGGAVLAILLEGDNAKRYDVTALTRSADKAKKFESLGVKAVVGSLDDLHILETIAAESDVVIECADADHLESTKALLAGLKKKHASSNRVPILIHTSGTAVLSDNAAGMHGTDAIYFDSDPEQLAAIAPTQPHRNVDLTVVAGDKEGYVKTYIVLPSTIYGLASGPLVDAGVVNPRSQQIPALIKASLDRRQAGMVGAGRNFHPNVHIDDMSRLYVKIVELALAGAGIGHGREGFYFGENGEHTMHDIAKAMGAVLKDMGLASTAEPSSFTKEERDYSLTGSFCHSPRAWERTSAVGRNGPAA